ncbi:MAG: tRNA glutamyl-Q(34) synthetase GluQRS [Thiohalobacteraceae bacterium]
MTNDRTEPRYCGRFAPSPTGPLHFGSLVAAVASYLDARSRGGRWLLRMEDLDKPREQPGAADAILRTLDRFGLHWDGPVLYQSQRADAYAAALERLRATGQSFPCGCTRREIADSALPGPLGPLYPGTCRGGIPPGQAARAERLRVNAQVIRFQDRLQPPVHQNLASEVGDFVVSRADGVVAYQLAVVVDDAEQGITDVVRGSDLLLSTPRQIYLQTLLGFATPGYLHLPVAVNGAGEKLSKQTYAMAVDDLPVPDVAREALTFLGQAPPDSSHAADLAAYWTAAAAAWDPHRIPRTRVLVTRF